MAKQIMVGQNDMDGDFHPKYMAFSMTGCKGWGVKKGVRIYSSINSCLKSRV